MIRSILLWTLIAGVTPRDDYPKNPNIDVLNYAFHLTLSDESDRIEGEATIEVRFRTAGVTTLRLDLINAREDGTGMTVLAVTSEGRDISYAHEGDALRITVPRASSAGRRWRVTVRYRGTPATGLIIGPNKYGERTFFSDNWPNRARHWLPTVDHPYDKAMCEFIVDAPDHYRVISNGLLLEETTRADGTRRTHWRQSVPIASWLFVLGAARFAVQYVDEYEGRSIQTWVYHQDRDAGFYDFAVPTRQAMEFYGDYVGPYAYEKLANVQSNSVGGGMEAATAIFYGDASVTGERTERWRNVIIHEVAHQWFGNAVTEYDWDDVWLSEGFATYFTLLFIEHAYGREEFVRGLISSRERVQAFYENDPDYRIVHDNLTDMSRVTSSNTYQKGGWTLHMLRGLIGDGAFWAGIQDYYREHFNGNASTDDFRRAMEEASGRDLEWFFRQWLYQGGTLAVAGEWWYDRGAGAVRIDLRQAQDDGYQFRMPIPVAVRFADGASVTASVDLTEMSQTFTIPVEREPSAVVLDPDVWVLMEAEFGPRR